MAQRPTFFQRARTLMAAMRWVLSAEAVDAQALQGHLVALAPAVATVPTDLSSFAIDEDDWSGDIRWELLLGGPSVDGELGRGAVRHALAFQLGLAVAREAGVEPLFWAALRHCAEHGPEERPAPGQAPEATSPDERLARMEWRSLSKRAQALCSVFPEAVDQARPWPQAWAAWLARAPQGQALAVGAMMTGLAHEPKAREGLPTDWLDTVAMHAPVPWPQWLVVVGDAPGLAEAMRRPGGPGQWPGVSQAWDLPERWGRAVRQVAQEFAARMKRMGLPALATAAGERRTHAADLGQMLGDGLTLASRAATRSSTACLRVLAGMGLPFPMPEDRCVVSEALRDGAMTTARELLGQNVPMPGEAHPADEAGEEGLAAKRWPLFDAKLLGRQKTRDWHQAEAAFLATRDLADLDEAALCDLMLCVSSHPLAWRTALKLVERAPMGPRVALHMWQAEREKDMPAPVVRDLLTKMVQQPGWPLECKEAIVARVFAGEGVVADTLIQAQGPDAQKLREGRGWEKTQDRPVVALTWALVHAPGCVPDLLNRSSPAQITQALAMAEARAGWLEGDSAGMARHKGVTHGWKQGYPAWAQATLSVDPARALAALAACPQTRQDLEANVGPANQSSLDFLMLHEPSQAAAAVLEAVEMPLSVKMGALREWVAPPRDLEAVGRGLLAGKLVDAVATKEGGTLLHYALGERDGALVAWLLAHGADVDAMDGTGQSARGLADQAGQEYARMVSQAVEARMTASLAVAPAPTAAAPRTRM